MTAVLRASGDPSCGVKRLLLVTQFLRFNPQLCSQCERKALFVLNYPVFIFRSLMDTSSLPLSLVSQPFVSIVEGSSGVLRKDSFAKVKKFLQRSIIFSYEWIKQYQQWEITTTQRSKKLEFSAHFTPGQLLACLRQRFRACLHGGGGPQIDEVTYGGHPTYHVNAIKLNWEIVWTGGLPHLPGVPHLHVNRPIVGGWLAWASGL